MSTDIGKRRAKSVMEIELVLNGNPVPANTVSISEHTIMNVLPSNNFVGLEQDCVSLLKFLIYSRLKHTRSMIPTEFERTFDVISYTVLSSID